MADRMRSWTAETGGSEWRILVAAVAGVILLLLAIILVSRRKSAPEREARKGVSEAPAAKRESTLRQYLADFPTGAQASEARAALDDLRAAAFKTAQSNGDSKSLRDFLARFPERSTEQSGAEQLLREALRRERIAAEWKTVRECREWDIDEKCMEFLRKNPYSQESQEARELLSG